MSTVSMTGFGRGSASSELVSLTVEVSSVNRRQLDCTVALPRHLSALESEVVTMVRRRVHRGQVRVSVLVNQQASGQSISLDTALIASEISALRDLARKLGLQGDFSADSLLRLPDALAFTSALSTDDVLPVLRSALGEALDRLCEMRSREGAALAEDISGRFVQLKEIHSALSQRAIVSPAEYKAKLEARLEKLSCGLAPDPEILARETVVFADRTDVSEELARIASHLAQAELIMSGSEPSGRPLDFLCQELLREINTTGSKASDAEIARMVIQFKSILETIREQVQNFE